MSITVKSGIGLNNNPLAKIVRQTVFVDEQGFTDEFDDIDDIAYHVVLFDKDKPVATGRCFTDEKHPKSYHIGRVAVLKEYRNKHLGDMIIKNLEDYIKSTGADTIELSSQYQVKPFYARHGYIEEGEEYLDQFWPHKKMVKKL